MKIAYECSGMSILPFTGVGNYVQQLLLHLLAVDRENSYWLFSHRQSAEQRAQNLNSKVTWDSTHFPNRLLWMQCVLPFALRTLKPDVAHFPNFVAPLAGPDNMIATIHDLGLIVNPNLFSPRQRILMRPFIQPTARRARALIAVSAKSKQDIVRILGVEPTKVHVIHEAAAPFFHEPITREECERRLARYGWDRASRHLLYVGTIEPRKNLGRLVAALSRLHQCGERPHLWIVGQRGWDSERLARTSRELGIEPFVHQPGYIPAADLRAFYHGCDVFVLPSLSEGFGLPVVEAMACGAPVIISDTPALREIAGDACLHFDPTDEAALAESLNKVLSDNAMAMELRGRGRVRAASFSWERAARETLALYNQR